MLNPEVLDNIQALIVPILRNDQYCLVDIDFYLQSGRPVLKLLVDKIYGGISLDECTRLNQKIGDIIEMEGIIEQGYDLEISSPGVDRYLVSREDFMRCLNRRVRIFLKEPQGKISEISGVITLVTETALELDSGGCVQRVVFDRIKKAKQEVLL